MQFKADTKKLKKLAATVVKAAGRNGNFRTLRYGNITLTTQNSNLIMRCCNDKEQWYSMNAMMPIQNLSAESKQRVQVAARDFNKALTGLTGTVEISEADGILTMRDTKGKTAFVNTDPTDAMTEPQRDTDTVFHLDRLTLLDILTRGEQCVKDTDTIRPHLTGIWFKIRPYLIQAAASDTHVIMWYMARADKDLPQAEFIVNRHGCKVLAAMLRAVGSEQITVSLGSKYIALSADGYEFVARLIGGHYPPVKRVFPYGKKLPTYSLKVGRSELAEAVKTMGNVAENVDICLKDGGASVAAYPDNGRQIVLHTAQTNDNARCLFAADIVNKTLSAGRAEEIEATLYEHSYESLTYHSMTTEQRTTDTVVKTYAMGCDRT